MSDTDTRQSLADLGAAIAEGAESVAAIAETPL
jgi:hypothetical protein